MFRPLQLLGANRMSKKIFLAKHAKNKELASAVIAQLDQSWGETRDDLEYVRNHGGGQGTQSFTYIHELANFGRKNKVNILEVLTDDCEQHGISSPAEMVKNFNTLKGQWSINEISFTLYSDNEDDYILQAIALYALETVAEWMESYEEEQN